MFAISNHDQVGNRAFGERLGHLTNAAAYRAASALLCLVPQTPLLFMGQEWNSSHPFQFFTDHNPKLGKAVTEGRRCEFRHFAAFPDAAVRDTIPDPEAEGTFSVSKLPWEELQKSEHAGIFRLYRECLKLRRAHIQKDHSRYFETRVLGDSAIAILFGEEVFKFAVVADLRGSASGTVPSFSEMIGESSGNEWSRVLSTNETRFGGSNEWNSHGPRMEAFTRGC